MNQAVTASITIPFVVSTGYAIQTWRHLSPIKRRDMLSSNTIPGSLESSKARAITNPNDHVALNDTRSVTVRIPRNLSDEVILARFVRGFFGGYIFGPERTILTALRRDVQSFEELRDTPISDRIRSVSQLSDERLPKLQSLLFGAFRVLDIKINKPDLDSDPKGMESYIDFAYGFDSGPIAGIHRFSVSHEEPDCSRDSKDTDNQIVRIAFAHTGCNPKVNKPMAAKWGIAFHIQYADLLFQEGAAKVIWP